MEGAGEYMIIVRDADTGRCRKHNSYSRDVIPAGFRSKLSQASQTNHDASIQQKISRSAQAQALYDCHHQAHYDYHGPIYRTSPVARTEYYTEFPPRTEFSPYRGNFASCRYLDLTRPCKSSTLWRDKARREHSPISSVTDPFTVSLRQYTSQLHGGTTAQLLRKLLIYTQSRSSPKSYNVRSLRTPIRKCHSAHKDKQLNNKAQKQSKDENLDNIYKTKSCKNIGRDTSRKPSPIDNKNGPKNMPQREKSKLRQREESKLRQREESKLRHTKVGAGTRIAKPDLSTTYDYLQNSSCSLYFPRGILDRTMDVRYLDDVTRCVKDTIKMLCESEKEISCPLIANRYKQHLMEHHHRDAQAQANFQQEYAEQKPSQKSWGLPLLDFDGDPLCAISSPCRYSPKKAHFAPTCSFGPVCYWPNVNDNDEQFFSDKVIGGIVKEWMKGIPINANFTPTDRIVRNRIVFELTNNLSGLITDPFFEAKARKVISNHLSDLPMWFPEGEAQIKFKNQIVDDLILKLSKVIYVVDELKNELFRWTKNVDYEPRYSNGEIVTDCKIVNSMAKRLEPLLLNQPENDSEYKHKLQREIYDELLNIPLKVRDEFKCKVIKNLADDLASRLVWLNAGFEISVAVKTRDTKFENSSIRNIIDDWMANIPVNPYFSQIDIELREQLAEDLANNLTTIRLDPSLKIMERDLIIKFLNNLPMWWPGHDDKDVFMNELADKLIKRLASPKISEEVKNIVTRWTRNINADDDITQRVLDRILPIISNRHRLDERDYKRKLKRFIGEELTNSSFECKVDKKSTVIDELAKNLIEKLSCLDTMESGSNSKNMDSQISYDMIYHIVNNWMKTFPVNHDYSIKEKKMKEQMAEDLADKLSQIINDDDVGPKVKKVTLECLKRIPIWTPDINEKDKYMIDMSNKLCEEILRFYKTEDLLKRATSEWAEIVYYQSPRDENGKFIDKTGFVDKVIQKIRPIVLNRPDNNDDYRDTLKKAILEELEKSPFEVKPKNKNRVMSELVEDLANNLGSSFNESNTSQSKSEDINRVISEESTTVQNKTEDQNRIMNELAEDLADYLGKLLNKNTSSQRTKAEPCSSVINDTVLKWLNEIPVKSNFKLEDDELRKELAEQLIKKLTHLTDNPGKLLEISTEAKAIKAATDCLKDLPIWRPAPGKQDNYNDELVAKLFKSFKDTVGSLSLAQMSKINNGYKHEMTSDTDEKNTADTRSSMKPKQRKSDARRISSTSKNGENRRKSSASNTGQINSGEISNGNKHELTSDADEKKTADTRISMKPKQRKSDARRISSNSKSEKKRKSSTSNTGRQNSNETIEDRQNLRHTKTKNRRKSSANDVGRIKSSDPNEDIKKSGDSKNGKSSKSRVNGTGTRKTNYSSEDRKSQDDKRKLSESRIGQRRQPSSSESSITKSSDSSGDRNKSQASNTDVKKSSDPINNKLNSSDSSYTKSRSSNSRSSENSEIKKPPSNRSDSSGIDLIDSNKSRSSKRKNKRKNGASGAYAKLPVERKTQSGGPYTDEGFLLRASNADNEKRNSINSTLPNVPSSDLSVDRDVEKKVFDILKNNSIFAHLSPLEETNVVKNITDKLSELPKSCSIEIKSYIDEAINEWMDVLEKKAMEKRFREHIIKYLKISPEMCRLLDKKSNQNLVYKLASRLTEYETKSSHNKVDEEKIKDEGKKFVQKVFKNVNIHVKNQSVGNISQAIINVIQHKNDLKQSFKTEVIQWVHLVSGNSKASSKKEHKRAIKKLVHDFQMLAARKTTDSLVINIMQEKILLFLETMLRRENIVMDSSVKKQHRTKLLNRIMSLMKQSEKNSASLNTLKCEISYWLVKSPLLKKAINTDYDRDMKHIFYFLLGLRRNRDSNRENSVKSVVSEFITETIEKSCGSIPAETKSILTYELLLKLGIQEHNNIITEYEDNTNKLLENDSGLSKKMDTLKSLIEKIIKNHIFLQSDFNRDWTKITEVDEIFYRDMTSKLVEILENKFFMIYGSRKKEVQDVPEHLKSLFHEKISPVDHSIVHSLTSEVMADVSINLGTERHETLKQISTETSKYNSNKLKKDNENDELCYLTYTEVASEDEQTPSKKQKNYSNQVFLKGRHDKMSRIYKTPSYLLCKTYNNDQNGILEKDQEHSKKKNNSRRSHFDQLCNGGYQSNLKDFSNKPIISGRYSVNVNGKGNKNKKGNLKGLNPPSTSQSSEDLTNNTYVLCKNISNEFKRGKSNSPIRRTASTDSSDDYPLNEENVSSIKKLHLYRSPINEPGVFNVPNMSRSGTSNAITRLKSPDTDLYLARIRETNRQHLLKKYKIPYEMGESHVKIPRGKIEKIQNEPRPKSIVIDNLSENSDSTKSDSIRRSIAEILIRRVGINYKEATKFADLLIEKTKKFNEIDDGAINKHNDSTFNTLKNDINDVFKNFNLDHMSEEAELSILNILTNQVVGCEVNDNIRTSLMNILTEVDENVAGKVADSLLDHVKRITLTDLLISPKIKSVAQDKYNSRRQNLTAFSLAIKSSLTLEDKQKFLAVKNDIVDLVKERIPRLTPSVTDIIAPATDDLLRIYMNTKENKELPIDDLKSVIRREIENFLLKVPIEKKKCKDDLVDEIAIKLHEIDSVIKHLSSGTNTSSFSRNPHLTHQQQEAFLRETKKMLNNVFEDNGIDLSQAKHSTLELFDKLREIITNNELCDAEKMKLMSKEFFQFFKTLPSQSGVIPDNLATQVKEQIPSILSKSLATSLPDQEDLNKDIIDFIRAKTGDMTPRSLQQLQAQVEEVVAVTKSILNDINMTPSEKSDIVKLGFARLISEIPRQSSETVEQLASELYDKIFRLRRSIGTSNSPSILSKSLATSLPNQKDLNKDIVDFIRAKTGDMTPRSLQQLKAKVEEVVAVTKRILNDTNKTPSEKSEIIKLGFANLISEIPRQPSETVAQQASELYDKMFCPLYSIVTTNSPSHSSSNEEIMFIRNNETRYLNQLMSIIRNWTHQVPIIRDEIDDPYSKDYMARDLAKDITDRQKYIQLNGSAKTSDRDELEYLKYQVFRWLNRTLDVNDLSPFVCNIEDLMEQIRRVPIPPLVKPSDKTLEDEITKWVQQTPYNKFTQKGNTKQIKELADKIQRHRGKPRANSKIDKDIRQFVPNIFKEDDTTSKALEIQLKTFLKNQGLLRDLNAKTYKTGAEDLYELVEDWCRDLPIYLGDLPEEQERVKTIKQNINSKLINKIGELNMNPQILNDDFLYEDLLLDEVDKVLTKVPRNLELEKYLPALKRDLISRVKGVREKIRNEQTGHAYIQELRDTIATSAPIPEPLYPNEMISFEILRDNLVDAFINLHFVAENNEDEIKYKMKISGEISKFCNNYLRRHPCTPMDPKLLSRQLYSALQSIPIPKDETMRSEIEEVKIKEILYDWVKELPLKEETGSELLQRKKTIAVLAKRLREIEKDSNINFEGEVTIRKEITKWFRRNPLKVGHESVIPMATDRIVERLKKSENVFDVSKAFTDDCSCLPNKLVTPPCRLNSEDRAHLKRIRDKYIPPCLSGKPTFTIDSSSQTIEPQTLCPNSKTQERLPSYSSKQSPFPCPTMISSASPYEMHQYPHVIVKDYIWDSMDSKISSIQTPRTPCRSKSPSCMQKQMSTQQPLPKCNSVSSQICPAYESVFPRSSPCKSSQSTQANADIPCSTPNANRIPDSQDSDDEDDSSEDYKLSACRPIIKRRVCRIYRPTGALYSSFLPRKCRNSCKENRPLDDFESSRCPNETKKQAPCSCKERNSKMGRKLLRYRDPNVAEEECLGHSEAECPHPSYMYFRN